MVNQVKTADEIKAMRTGGRMLAQVLDYLTGQLRPGITTKELADLAGTELKKLGGRPAFLGYKGFPDVICINVNEELQHTIPGPRVIKAGDIVNFDFGVEYDGLVTDAAITVGVGEISADARRLVQATAKALSAGIAAVRDGARVGDISGAVEPVLRAAKLGVVEDLVGHGVGHQLHEDPSIPNYGAAGRGMQLKAGMTLAIEPMATLGSHEIVFGTDGWTIYTADGSLAAQFEHTVLVTDTGAEILTQT